MVLVLSTAGLVAALPANASAQIESASATNNEESRFDDVGRKGNPLSFQPARSAQLLRAKKEEAQ
ncbi:MAG: hypothetical protein VCA55_14610 [Verrucomicrobiales bacterium]